MTRLTLDLLGRFRRPRLSVGDLAPGFVLAASDGLTYRLGDLLGGGLIIIAWFPKAFTPGCRAECQSLCTSGNDLRKLDVKYFAASVDSVESNTRFARSLGIDFPILSDPTKATAKAYGVLGLIGYAARWTFYIGGDGVIVDIDRTVSVATHGRDVAAKLDALTRTS